MQQTSSDGGVAACVDAVNRGDWEATREGIYLDGDVDSNQDDEKVQEEAKARSKFALFDPNNHGSIEKGARKALLNQTEIVDNALYKKTCRQLSKGGAKLTCDSFVEWYLAWLFNSDDEQSENDDAEEEEEEESSLAGSGFQFGSVAQPGGAAAGSVSFGAPGTVPFGSAVSSGESALPAPKFSFSAPAMGSAGSDAGSTAPKWLNLRNFVLQPFLNSDFARVTSKLYN